MGKKSVADVSFDESHPTEVRDVGPKVLFTASLLDKLKSAHLTRGK